MIDYYARIADGDPAAPARPPADPGASRRRRGKHFYEKRAPEAHARLGRDRADRGAGAARVTIDFCVCDDLRDADLAGAARRARAPSVALAGRRHRAPDRPRLRPRPRARRRRSSSAAGWRCGCASCSSDLGLECFPKTSGLEGHPGLRAAEHDDHLRARRSRSPTRVAQALERQSPTWSSRRMTKELRKGKVFVDWSQNDSTRPRSRSTRCAPGSGPRSRRPLDLGRGRGAAQATGTPTSCASRPPRCWSGSTSTATCSRRCSSSKQKLPDARSTA